MDIKIEVTGSTHLTIRAKLYLCGNFSGDLQVNRADFTKLCDLIFQESYVISTPKNHEQA